jgi:hypothetical protein
MNYDCDNQLHERLKSLKTEWILKKLEEIDGKEQYQVEISNRAAALENSDDDVDINRA